MQRQGDTYSEQLIGVAHVKQAQHFIFTTACQHTAILVPSHRNNVRQVLFSFKLANLLRFWQVVQGESFSALADCQKVSGWRMERKFGYNIGAKVKRVLRFKQVVGKAILRQLPNFNLLYWVLWFFPVRKTSFCLPLQTLKSSADETSIVSTKGLNSKSVSTCKIHL